MDTTPYQIKRIAEAEAKAEEIRVLAEIKIDRIQRRAATRFIAEETKKQINMETIIRGALPQVSEEADPRKMEDDWVTNFVDKCRLVSDEQMQSLWSKILAGEANNPGNFSKRTVNLVAELAKWEVELFIPVCRYALTAPDGDRYPIIVNYDDLIYRQNGLTYPTILELANIGLITMNSLGNFTAALGPDASLRYFDKTILVNFLEGRPRKIVLGLVAFTGSGLELSKLSIAGPVPGLIEYVTEYWERHAIATSVVSSSVNGEGAT